MRERLLTVFGLGTLPRAPGTWGSLATTLLFTATILFIDSWLANLFMIALVIVFSVATVRLGPWAEQRWGRSDPPQVVSDEVAGQSLVFLCLPWGDVLLHAAPLLCVLYAIVGFGLFRILDILKPPPIGLLQHLPHGWGILLDDLMAGLLAGLGLWLVAMATMF
tara:strand:+ start:12293 stop:12784 length:492 start_codon:yes stop_codon:yes gene_type:complete